MYDHTEVPEWFTLKRELVRTSHVFDVAGARISSETFTPRQGPVAAPILFVHGGGANAAWWHPAIALVATHRAMATIDLSGHGLSDWRERYSHRVWRAEISAVATALFPKGCVLVGHSMGGALACGVAARGLYAMRTIVSVDGNPLGPPPGRTRLPLPAATVYESAEDGIRALARAKPAWPAWMIEYVGRRSVVEVPGGWRMRRDPIAMSLRMSPTRFQDLPPLPTLLVHGGRSPFLRRDLRLIERNREEGMTHLSSCIVPDAGHDVMMEDPAALAAILNGIP